MTIGDTLGNVEAETMIENLAYRLPKVKVEALGDKLTDFKA